MRVIRSVPPVVCAKYRMQIDPPPAVALFFLQNLSKCMNRELEINTLTNGNAEVLREWGTSTQSYLPHGLVRLHAPGTSRGIVRLAVSFG